MEGLHAIGGVISAASAGALVLAAAAAGTLDAGHEWVRRAALVVTAVFAAQGFIGLFVMLTGGSFGEGLHLVYGLGLAAAVPLGLTFASDAPDRARSWVTQ